MTRKIIPVVAGAALLGCNAGTTNTAASKPSPPAMTAVSPAPAPVHAITLPSLPTDLPDGPGKQAVLDRCVVCHSPRYITMQPPFSRTVWTAEVDKMRKTFGAPVSDEQADDIVNYLVSIRGTPADAATNPAR
jgi:hypothetical protein